MQKHTKVYMQFFDYGEQDFIPCEMCGSKATDIHHIERRTRNKVTNDFVENLVGLCRDCHIKAESDTMFNMQNTTFRECNKPSICTNRI
jgi:hypothetical protein